MILTSSPLIDLDGMSVTEIMEPYFRQMGYPVLKVNMTENELVIRTSRFLSVKTPKNLPKSSFKYLWHVPLILEEGGVRRSWLETENKIEVIEINSVC